MPDSGVSRGAQGIMRGSLGTALLICADCGMKGDSKQCQIDAKCQGAMLGRSLFGAGKHAQGRVLPLQTGLELCQGLKGAEVAGMAY